MKGFWKHLGQKWYDIAFLAVAIFFLLISLFGTLGFLPPFIQEEVQPDPLFKIFTNENTNRTETAQGNTSPDKNTVRETPSVQYHQGVEKETPIRLVIPSIGVDTTVVNPQSQLVTVLNKALTDGAVRYPSSGLLNEKRNVYIFGHSAYSKVLTQAFYRTFNGFERLKQGSEIRVYGTDYIYIYRVANVSFIKDTIAYVDVDEQNQVLTLSTCNAFGAKDDRIIVRASFVNRLPLDKISI